MEEDNKIYLCRTLHSRFIPVEHSFNYPLFYFGIDLNNINQSILFSYNKWTSFSIHDKDYFNNSQQSIKHKLLEYLNQQLGYTPNFKKILFISTPRVFGYAFNPVSFYFCYDEALNLSQVIYEVNNTFGERHIYILNQQEKDNIIIERDFHVSPFNNRKGVYETAYLDPIKFNKLMVKLVFKDEHNNKKFMAKVEGKEIQLNNLNMIYCLLNFSYHAILTMPRILYEAYVLHYNKHLKVYPRPNPSKQSILFKDPDFIESYSLTVIQQYLLKLSQHFNITIILNLPSSPKYANPKAELNSNSNTKETIIINFYGYELFTSLLLESMTKQDTLSCLASSFMRGVWSCDKLELFLYYWSQFDINQQDHFNFIQSNILFYTQYLRQLSLYKILVGYQNQYKTLINNNINELALPIHLIQHNPIYYNIFDNMNNNIFSLLYNLIYILLGLFFMNLEMKLFDLLASFQSLKSPSENWKRYYINLILLLKLDKQVILTYPKDKESFDKSILEDDEKLNLLTFMACLQRASNSS